MKKTSLDGRSENNNGRIRAKNGNTEVGTLRDIYGDSFEAGTRSDTHLKTVLDRAGVDSLSQYLKQEK